MKFTPQQVIEMRQQADAAATAQLQCEGEFHPDWQEVADGIFATLAADRALEAAAQKCDSAPERQRGDGVYAADQAACAKAIRAMKEHQ